MRKLLFAKDKILQNKFVLIILGLISTFQIIAWLNTNGLQKVILFIVTAIITSQYNKNMIVIMTVALVITHILNIAFRTSRNLFEGMTDEHSDDEKPEDEHNNKEKKEKEENKPETNNDADTVNELKDEGKELIATQKIIMENFNKLSPELDKVDALVDKMNKTADKLNNPEIKNSLMTALGGKN